jgi:hypothetical protein
MDLRNAYPRSPNEPMAGLLSLARTVDKARAFNAGTLGEYHYDCPHDKRLLRFLGIDAAAFAKRVAELGSDDRIAEWVKRNLLARTTTRDIDAFNHDSRHWQPYPGSQSEQSFLEMRRKVAPDRDDIKTWFELLDLDEKRYVPHHLAFAA